MTIMWASMWAPGPVNASSSRVPAAICGVCCNSKLFCSCHLAFAEAALRESSSCLEASAARFVKRKPTQIAQAWLVEPKSVFLSRMLPFTFLFQFTKPGRLRQINSGL